jgi:hypothetical protein
MITAMRTETRAKMRTAYIDGGGAHWFLRQRPLSHSPGARRHHGIGLSSVRARSSGPPEQATSWARLRPTMIPWLRPVHNLKD